MDTWTTIPAPRRVPLILQWLHLVEQGLGIRPIIYTNLEFVKEALPGADPLASYLLWVAQYSNQQAPSLTAVWRDWTFWQYSGNGTMAGIMGSVELKRLNGAAADLSAVAKQASQAASQ